MLVRAGRSSREGILIMNQELVMLVSIIQSGTIFAPVLFILFHVARQVLFIPVAVVCMTGGLLFGPLAGTIYSIIGLTLSSLVFYGVSRKVPKLTARLFKMKNKLFGHRKLNVKQITVLRLIPFVHYHMLSLCLMELKKGWRAYASASFATNIPLAFFYTVFGHYIRAFSPTLIVLILCSFTLLVYLMREKQTVIKWQEFFQVGN